MQRFVWAGLAGVLLTGSASTQVQHAPDGGTWERMQSIDVPSKPGAPFHAEVATSWKRRLEDGTEFTVYNRRVIARDSTGRVFQERRMFAPDGNTRQTAVSETDFFDPGLRQVTICTPRTHQCLVHPWMYRGGDAPPLPATQTFPNGTTVTRESLGQSTMESLPVSGSRKITTHPRLGAAEPTVKEFWYSPRLGMNIVVKRFEPRGGAEDFRVEHIEQSEPDAALFQLPRGYQVVALPQPRPAGAQ